MDPRIDMLTNQGYTLEEANEILVDWDILVGWDKCHELREAEQTEQVILQLPCWLYRA